MQLLTKGYVGSQLDNRDLQKRFANLFFVLAIIFGIFIIFLMPPFVSLDEHYHFLNILRMSHGDIFVDVENGVVGSYITTEEAEFFRHVGWYELDEVRFDYADLMEHANMPVSGEFVFYTSYSMPLNPISYMLPSAVIGVLRLLGFSLNAFNAFWIAKLVNLCAYALIIRWAIIKTGALPKTMFMLALMPMSMMQAASTSYDAFVISASFLLFAYVTKILRSDTETKICIEDIIAICLSTVFIVGCKYAYAPLLLVLFAIPYKKFGTLKKYLICICCVVITAVIALGVPEIIKSVILSGGGIGEAEGPLQMTQKDYLFDNIWKFPGIVVNTIKTDGIYWLNGFFGIIGTLDAYFPAISVAIFYIVLIFVAFGEVFTTDGIKWNARVLSIVATSVFFIGTVYVMYVEWTPMLTGNIGGNYAFGGQGRYFIPIIMFVLLVICSQWLTRFKGLSLRISKYSIQTVPMVSSLYLAFTLLIIISRYWI